MMRPRAFWLIFVCCLPAAAQPATRAAATKPAAAGPRPTAVAATRGTVRATIERAGTLVPAEADEIALDLEHYAGELRVLEVLPDGAPVSEGDVLVRLDTRKIDEQIRDAAFALKQREAQNRQAEEKRRLAEAAARDDLRRAERQSDWAERRLKGYREQEKAHQRENERLRTQSEDNRLEDQQDELTQLEKMYKEDELVDATEEIVLKRSRRRLAYTRASIALSRRIRAYRRALNDVIHQEELELDAAAKAAALERKRRSAELATAGRQLERERARRDLEKQRELLARLRRDRDRMTVRAPRRGILLHGEARGAPGAGKLKRGSTLRARKVFLTVAAPDRFQVVTDIPEKDLYRAKSGTAATVKVTALAELALAGAIRVKLLATGRDPKGQNLYATTIPLAASDPRLRPRMRCAVTLIVDEAKNAVLIPQEAVVEREGQAFVKWARTAKGPFEERRVALGCSDGKRVAVKDGVEEGEFVLVPGKAPK